ncbi:MAG: enoyl-CoA hydratase/isomerase family protein [Desulfobacterales bacterium]|jgi:enoyl-CoA hydratase/carnithine racemase
MTKIEYVLKKQVAVISLNSGDNRFNPDFIKGLLDVLDDIEHRTSATVVVAHSTHENIFSNGIDLEWLSPILQNGGIETAKDFFRLLNRLFVRMLSFPAITIGAINGHAFAGGAIFSCAFDFRFMQTGRGFFCLPEIDINIPFLPGMNAILGKAIPRYQLDLMELTGVRLTAEECEAHHIILKACPPETVVDEAMQFAEALDKNRETIAEMKRRLNRKIIQTIETEDEPFIASGIFHIG